MFLFLVLKLEEVRGKAAIKRAATEVFRVATECGYGLTKGSESPLTTGAV